MIAFLKSVAFRWSSDVPTEMEMCVIKRDQDNRLLIDCFCGKRIHIPRNSCCLLVAERHVSCVYIFLLVVSNSCKTGTKALISKVKFVISHIN